MLTVLGILFPVAVLGLIAWIVVGFLQSRKGESFTLATATALYSRVVLVAGVIMALAGVGSALKAAFGFINLSYSYFDYATNAYKGAPPGAPVPPVSPVGYLEQQRGQDLVLGITLIGIGVLVAVAHYYIARALATKAGGSPTWIARGTLLALTVTTAVGAIPTSAIGIYQMLSFFILGGSQNAVYGIAPQTWGDPVGAAIAFVPAWIYVMRRLVRDLRTPYATAPGSAAGVAAPAA